MALSGMYTTMHEILERVYRDYGFEEDLDWNDAVVWVADALDLIGAPRAYTPMITDGVAAFNHYNPITITNHRGDLPCDLHLVVQAREWNTKIPMIWNSDSFHAGIHIDECAAGTTVSCTSLSTCATKSIDVVPSVVNDENTHCNPFFNFNPNPTSNTAFSANSPTVDGGISFQKELSYTLSGGKIFTSFKTGAVELAYWAFPTDDEGYPLIPAETRFQEAVKNYLAHRISFKLDIQGKMPAGKADKLEQEWLFYCASAGILARIPSIDQMEALKNQWLRTIPNINEHSNNFSTLNESERRNNLNR